MTTDKRMEKAVAAAEQARAERDRRREERARQRPAAEKAVADRDHFREIRAKRKAEADAARTERAQLQVVVDRLAVALRTREQQIAEMHQAQARDQAKLDELKTRIRQLRAGM
jgi:hypothetical protein